MSKAHYPPIGTLTEKKPYCMAVDWLQMNCAFIEGETWNTEFFTIEALERKTQHFNKIEYIFKPNPQNRKEQRLIATAASEPNKAGIDPKTVLLKFENDILYQADLVWEVKEFLALNNLKFRNITRLDIACDFLKFENGKFVPTLLREFATGKILRLGKANFADCGDVETDKTDVVKSILSGMGESISKADLSKLLNDKIKRIHGERYKIVGEVRQKITRDYLRFGSHTSEVSTYIYNKTKELMQVKYKPWIVENWKAAGLISDPENKGIDTCPEVWRLEVSFKGSRKVLKKHSLKKTNKELSFKKLEKVDKALKKYSTYKAAKEVTFSDFEIINPENIEMLWKSGVNQYFSFCKNNGLKNKSRMKKIDLFDFSDLQHVLINKTSKKDSSRSDKIYIKRLEKTNTELQGTDDDMAEMANDLKQYYIYSRGLHHLNKEQGSLKQWNEK